MVMIPLIESFYSWLICLIQIWLTSKLIWGMYYATRVNFSLLEDKFTQKEILWFVKWYGDLYLPEWIRKPLYDCPMCMASFWSIVTGLFFGFNWTIFLIIPAVCGMNYITNRMFPYSEE